MAFVDRDLILIRIRIHNTGLLLRLFLFYVCLGTRDNSDSSNYTGAGTDGDEAHDLKRKEFYEVFFVYLEVGNLRILNIHKYNFFLYSKYRIAVVQNIKNRFQKATCRTVLRQGHAVFCIYLRICDLRINHEHLRICDLRTGTANKFADLR